MRIIRRENSKKSGKAEGRKQTAGYGPGIDAKKGKRAGRRTERESNTETLTFQLVATLLQDGPVRVRDLQVEAEGLKKDAFREEDFVGHFLDLLETTSRPE